MGRTKQGGSVLGYVLVGGVLILLLLGGAYVFRTYFSGGPEVAKQPAATAPASSNADDKKPDDKPKTTPEPAKPTPAPTAPTQTATPQQSGSATQLPQTGPVDVMMAILALGALTASLGVYLQSRRLASFDL